MNMKFLFATLIFNCGTCALLKAQTTFPANDVKDAREGYYVFYNANVHQDYQTVIEKAALIIKEGKVESIVLGAGADKFPGAVAVDLQGKHIYPSFIDLFSNYGLPEVKRSQYRSRERPQMESNKTGPYGWNQAVHPENNSIEIYKNDSKSLEELRKMGFGAVLTHLPDGIMRGTGVLVTLSDERENITILNPKGAAHLSFDKGTSTQDNPSSLMGSIALLRQTYLDADWYKKSGYKEQSNLTLQALNINQGLPQIFETNNKLNSLRADKIGDEFGIQYIIKGAGDEYQRIDEIKATNAPFILPINFPQPFDVEDPEDANYVSLEELKHWEMAPGNLAALAGKGIIFSITSAGLKNKSDFLPNIRKAIQYGLDEKTALKALTFSPAQMIKEENRIGGLKNGMMANFIIASDNIFKDGTVIFENWVQGKKFIVNPAFLSDIRGLYELNVDGQALKLNITGPVDKNEYKIEKDTSKITPKITRNGDLFTINYNVGKSKDNIRLTGYLIDKNIKGEGQAADGKNIKWSAIYKGEIKDTTGKGSKKPDLKAEMGKIIYPFVAFGNEEKPKSETILIKNATVWTNEKDGKLEGTDVLLMNGKIAKIGKNLSEDKSKIIDGKGKHLTFGIMDEHSHIAISSGINEGTQSVSAEVRIGDVINPEDINIYRQLSGGVVASQLLHGSANCIGGQSAFVKLKWGSSSEEMKVNNVQFIKFALGENVKQSNWGDANVIRFPQTRMGVEQVMTDAFTRAKEYEDEWKVFNSAKDKGKLKSPRRDLELDALVEILNKKRFITCHSYVQSEINMLMKVAEKFGIRINTFTHILEGYKLADKMAKHGAGGSTFSDWWAYKMEVYDAIPYNAALMHKLGVTVSINSDDAEMARRLNQEAGKTIKYGGVSEEDALKMVTLNVAKLMHVENKMGSIKVGKDASVVLWTDHPLSIYARADKTIIDGAIYYDLKADEQKRIDLQTERNRIIQKMLTAKNSGSNTQKPTMKPQKIWHCEDVADVFRNGESGE